MSRSSLCHEMFQSEDGFYYFCCREKEHQGDHRAWAEHENAEDESCGSNPANDSYSEIGEEEA